MARRIRWARVRSTSTIDQQPKRLSGEPGQALQLQAKRGLGTRVRDRARDSAQLSKRQREIVSCLALGLTTEEVAVHLGIARGTAVNHRAMAALALGLGSVVQLTHYAILQGWVQAGDALSPERIDAALAKVANDVGALQR